jgi:hypothetical protein
MDGCMHRTYIHTYMGERSRGIDTGTDIDKEQKKLLRSERSARRNTKEGDEERSWV